MPSNLAKVSIQIWAVLIILVLLFLGVRFLGAKYFVSKDKSINNQEDTTSNEHPNFIASKNGIALFTIHKKDRTEIKVNRANEDFWIDVSLNERTANNPSLSNNGQKVAYFFNNGANNGITILDFSLKKRFKLFAKDIEIDKAIDTTAINFSESDVCNWSPVVWSNDSVHISFFVNDLSTMKNYAAIVNIKNLLKPIYTKIEKGGFEQTSRQMLWLDDKKLLVSRFIKDELLLDTLTVK